MKHRCDVKTVRDLLSHKDGRLFWKVDVGRWGRIKAGTFTGSMRRDGYLEVGLQKTVYLAHHLVFVIEYGRWPERMMDHINGIRNDNRPCNLREISESGNSENKHGPQKNNELGVLGVHKLHYGKYRARIQVNGKPSHIGVFDTAEEAHAAYIGAKRALHQHNTL
jgi:HNH endonuclease